MIHFSSLISSSSLIIPLIFYHQNNQLIHIKFYLTDLMAKNLVEVMLDVSIVKFLSLNLYNQSNHKINDNKINHLLSVSFLFYFPIPLVTLLVSWVNFV